MIVAIEGGFWPMAAYVVSFSIVVVLLKAAEKVKEKQQWVLECAAIVVLCLLAGLRSDRVGTDTSMYLQPCVRAAISAGSYQEFLSASWYYGWKTIETSNYEAGFLITVFIVAKLFRSVWVVQFVLQLLIITPVYIVLKRTKDVPLWFGMLVYMLVFFNRSLNIIRQAVAVSFVFLSTQLWMDQKRKKSIISLVVAILFHLTGWVGVLIILIYNYVEREREDKVNFLGIHIDARLRNMVVVVTTSVFLLLSMNFLSKLLQGTMFARFAGYIAGDVRFMPNQLVKLLPPLVIMVCNFKQIEEQSKHGSFYMTLLLLSIVFLQLTAVNSYGGRLAEYFMCFGVLSYPLACNRARKIKLFTAIMIGYLLYYWFFYYGYGNSGETIPYEMMDVG